MENIHEMDAISLMRQPSTAQPERLTPRQREVLALLCEGLPNKLISRRLNIASGTVKIHVAHILHALNVSSRLQAVIAARSCGLEPGSGDAGPARQEPGIAPQLLFGLRLGLDDDDASSLLAATSARSMAAAVG